MHNLGNVYLVERADILHHCSILSKCQNNMLYFALFEKSRKTNIKLDETYYDNGASIFKKPGAF